jgi:hypothetical protein
MILDGMSAITMIKGKNAMLMPALFLQIFIVSINLPAAM